MLYRHARLWLALLLLTLLGSPVVHAQGADEETAPQPKMVEIKIDQELEIKDFLDQISKTTGRPLLYDPRNNRIAKQTLGAGFSHRVPEDRVFDMFRAILAFYELVLVPIGPRGYEIYLVIDSRSTNNLIKNKATYVDYRELERYADQDGLFISCAVPLRHIENLTTLRTALSSMTSTGGMGRVHEVPGSNSIIINDFAPSVAAMAKLITQMDVLPPGKKMVLEFIEMEYAYADDVASIVSELVTVQRQATQQARRGQPQSIDPSPEPRIMAYEPKNALVIAATEDDYTLILGLVERFDQPGPAVSQVEVIRLNHVEAEDLSDTLQQVLDGLGGMLAGATPGAQQPGARPRQPGIQRTSSGSGDFEPQVVPDPTTNSLIIAADRKTIGSLREIIEQLDLPKDQVLIEATVISLTRQDDFELGVELVGIDDGGLNSSSASGFGVTNFGLSTFEDTDGDLIPDINLPTNLSQEGGGLVAGIFRNGGIPVLLQAAQRLSNAELMSMPSVITYDNESAVLESLQEQPVGTTTEANSGAIVNGFNEFVDAGVKLTVSPHISSDNYLRLDIELEVSSFVGDPPSSGLPSPKIVNTIRTTVALPHDHTVVMGGLISEDESVTEAKVPLLGDIPGLGFLFKNKTRRKVKRNLFMFVTPHILRQRQSTFEDLHRQSWIAKMKADELISQINIHNSKFRYDPRFRDQEDAEIARLDVSSMIDAGRFQEVPSDQALLELEQMRRRAKEADQK